MGVFNDICFGGVGLLAADMARYQATRSNQHICSLLATARKRLRLVLQGRLK